MEQETRKCPYCGEEILAVAKKCKHCGEWLTEDKAENTPKQMIHCPVCSEMIEEGTEICPHCHEKITKRVSTTAKIYTEHKEDGTKEGVDSNVSHPTSLKKIGIMILVALLIVAAIIIALTKAKNNNCNDNTSIKQIEETNETITIDDNSKTPYGILSAQDGLILYDMRMQRNKIEQFLLKRGYEYVDEVDNSAYWAKNCKLGRGQYGYGETDSSPDGSYIIIGESIIEIYAFSESVFKAWFSQIKDIGYVLDDEEGHGNQQLEWNASKDGEPDISFIEGSSYGMSIGSYEY